MITMNSRDNESREDRRYGPVVAVLVLLAIGARAMSKDCPPPSQVTPAAERAILSGDWEQVLKTLGPVDGPNLPPVIRMIAGHAYLATNRNNDALRLFASALNDADRQAWNEWTASFVAGHGRSAVAQYLRGDALARQQDWQAASACFDEALRLDPQCYLAANARGVVAHAVGNTIEARMYFLKTARIKKDFADAYASRGTLNVYLHSVARDRRGGQEQPFETAQHYSRDENAVVALIGRGCVLYGQQNYEGALACFQAVPDASDLAPLARRNGMGAATARLERSLKEAQRLGTFVQTMELDLADNQKVTVQTEPSSPGVVFSASWGVTEIEINLGIINIHVGPKPGSDTGNGGKGGDNGGDNGGDKGGDKGGNEGGDKDAGKDSNPSVAPNVAMLPLEILPRNPYVIDLPDLTGGLTDGRIETPQLPGRTGDLYSNLATALTELTSTVDRQTASVASGPSISPSNTMSQTPTAQQGPLGGVNGNVAGITSNRGDWSVCSVYGLLYRIPTEGDK